MRILALTRYERLGSSSRVRFYQYFPYLISHGVEIITAPFFNDAYVRNLYLGQQPSLTTVLGAYLKRLSMLLRSSSFDLLWIEKEVLPWIPAWFEGLFDLLKIPYVVDYDDAVFHRYDMHSSVLVRAALGRKIDRVMQHARLVVAGNEYLAQKARTVGARKVECLPSVVDVSQYSLIEPAANHIFRIGWIGSPVTAQYLELVHGVLGRLSRQMEIHLTLIGSGDVQSFSDVSVEVLPWSEEGELRLSEKFDVGIMPLADGPFERGKCGYKLIQYMASALPVVASPVGVNQKIVDPGVNGYLASSPADWLAALKDLHADVEKRKSMGLSGRRKAEQMYNLQVTAPRLLDLLSSVWKS